MGTNPIRIAGAVLFVIAIFATGFWLSRSGKPYNGVIFTLHKLIALAAVALFVVVLYRIKQAGLMSPLELIAGVVTTLFFAGLFVTGALSSIDKPTLPLVLRVHHLTPYLAVLSTTITLYLVSGRK
jgi:hypothetical protein